MKENKSLFIDIINRLKPAIGSGEVDQSDHILFMDGGVHAFNDEIAISQPLSDLDFEGAVSAKEFIKFLSKLEAEEIKFKEKNDELVIEAGKSKAGFKLRDITSAIQAITNPTPPDWISLDSEIMEAINFVSSCASRDTSLPVFNCINVHQDGWVEATDRYRIAQYIVDIPVNTFMLPLKTAKILYKYNPDEITMIDEGWVHFSNPDGTVIVCRVYNDKFPDTTEIVKKRNGKEITFPDNIDKLIERSDAIFRTNDLEDQEVLISVKKGKITFQVENSVSWFKEECDIDYEGEPLSFKGTPKLLKDIFKQTNIATVTDERDRLYFDGPNYKWTYVAMLRKEE